MSDVPRPVAESRPGRKPDRVTHGRDARVPRRVFIDSGSKPELADRTWPTFAAQDMPATAAADVDMPPEISDVGWVVDPPHPVRWNPPPVHCQLRRQWHTTTFTRANKLHALGIALERKGHLSKKYPRWCLKASHAMPPCTSRFMAMTARTG